MATRFYIPDTNSTIQPAQFGAWTTTSSTFKKLVTVKTGTALDTSTATTTNDFRRRLILVSEPMAAGNDFAVSSVTYAVNMRCSESNALANATLSMYVGIVSEDGTTLRDASGEFTDSVEWATSLSSRDIGPITSGLLGYTTVDGDRLVVELGFRRTNTTSYIMGMDIGDSAASDLSGSADTSASNPWFEVSLDIVFKDPNTNQMMMMGMGT